MVESLEGVDLLLQADVGGELLVLAKRLIDHILGWLHHLLIHQEIVHLGPCDHVGLGSRW